MDKKVTRHDQPQNAGDRKPSVGSAADLFPSLFQCANEGICLHEIICDEDRPVDYRILEVNPKYETITGIARHDAVGALASELYGSGEPPYLDIFALVVRTGRPTTFEDYFPPMDKHFLISVFAFAKRRFATVFQDITAIKKTEEALRESEERFRMAYYTTPDAVNINRLADGMYVDINEGFTRMTGYTREDVIGKTSLDVGIWCNSADREKLVKALGENGVCQSFKAEFMMKNGKVAIGSMSARVVNIRSVPHIISITRDIHKRVKLEQEKEQLISELQTALSEVKTLRGLIPICANCKNVRDDKGYWNQIESYISANSDAQFTHGICPECAKELYPELNLNPE